MADNRCIVAASVSSVIKKGLWAFAGCVILLSVALSFAQIARLDFEAPATTRWKGPVGGGANGGCGGGTLVSSDKGDHVHGGRHALRLEVWDDGSSDHAVAWAGVLHHMSCRPGAPVRAEGWVYFSSTNAPLIENSSVHLQIEFFRDADGEQLMPEYVCVSPPVNPSTHSFDEWHRVSLRGRVPAEARSLRAGLIVTAHRLGGRRQTVWVDDLLVEVQKKSTETAAGRRERAVGASRRGNSIVICSSSRYK